MPPAVAAAGIMAAGSIGGALIGSSSASDAAQAQQQSDAQAIAEHQREFDIDQANFKPYLNAGTSALGGLGGLLGLNGGPAQAAAIKALQASPLYQSLYRNGLEANLQNASATGGLRGGNEARSLADFGSDTLASVIQNQIANLGGIAGMGEGATNAVGGFGANAANAIGSLFQSQGNAAASSDLAQGGLWAKALSNIGSSVGGLFGGSPGNPVMTPYTPGSVGGINYDPSAYGF